MCFKIDRLDSESELETSASEDAGPPTLKSKFPFKKKSIQSVLRFDPIKTSAKANESKTASLSFIRPNPHQR